MQWSFWLNLFVGALALVAALCEHKELSKAFRSSRGVERLSPGAKLLVLWGTFVASLLLLCVTLVESAASEKEIKDLKSEVLELKPKPFPDRLRLWLESALPDVIPGLLNGTNQWRVQMSMGDIAELEKFLREQEAGQYIRLLRPDEVGIPPNTVLFELGVWRLVCFEVSTNLINRP
jgi:hypothetical protein